jgi:hypothetical protein
MRLQILFFNRHGSFVPTNAFWACLEKTDTKLSGFWLLSVLESSGKWFCILDGFALPKTVLRLDPLKLFPPALHDRI